MFQIQTWEAVRTRELTAANLHLEELASTDMLTGLHNRRHALRRLAIFWQEALTTDSPLVCIMIDADHFKEVNDTWGHEAGDRVLQMLSQTPDIPNHEALINQADLGVYAAKKAGRKCVRSITELP